MDYTANQSAQGLASLGRGNDSMLVHMTPREVQGLQGLAMAHGGSLTTNPQTGLPEAGFLDSILPMAAGFALGPGGFGLFSSPLMAGLAVGGITALTSGDIGKGLMAGLGAGSGAGLGSTFAKMGQSAVGGITPEAAKMAVGENIVSQLPANVAQNAATNLGMFNAPGATATMGGVGSTVPNALQSMASAPTNIGPGVNSAVNAMGTAPTSTQIAQSTLSQPVSGFGASAKGFGQFMEDPLGKGFEAFKEAGGEPGKPLTSGEAAFKLGSPVASLALSAMEPEPYKGYVDPDTGKWRSATGSLSLSDKFDTGLRLAEGGSITTGGIRDLYGTRDDQLRPSMSTDGYGLGRLNSLAGEQAMTQAQSLGYAEGGDVASTGEGAPGSDLPSDFYMSDIQRSLMKGLPTYSSRGLTTAEGIASIDPSLIRGDMVDDMAGLPYTYDRVITPGALDFYTIPPLEYSPEVYAGTVRRLEGMAKGGYLNGNGDGMSDSIPATIEGKQPARLADGEFVVPADVVSHLGNGSSKAGSKRLYAMLDKVRQARTGTKKQGKEIKPEKYMPA